MGMQKKKSHPLLSLANCKLASAIFRLEGGSYIYAYSFLFLFTQSQVSGKNAFS